MRDNYSDESYQRKGSSIPGRLYISRRPYLHRKPFENHRAALLDSNLKL